MTNPAKPPIHILVFDASLGSGSLNDRLATLVASIAGQRVTVDRGRMEDFERRMACLRARNSSADGSRRPTRS